MNRSIRLHRLLAAGLLAGATAAGPLAMTAHSAPGPDVPGAIEVEEGNKVFLVGHAVGVQIYSCNATPGGFRWGFAGPRADLFDDDGKLIATHYGGPTWRARDGSTVAGSRVDG